MGTIIKGNFYIPIAGKITESTLTILGQTLSIENYKFLFLKGDFLTSRSPEYKIWV